MRIIAFISFFVFYFHSEAQTEPIRHFKVDSATFSSEHAQFPKSAMISVNYKLQVLHLHISQAQATCLEGRVCAQVMPELIRIELPITSIQKTECGIFNIVGEQDFRPIDGTIHRIEVQDASEALCHEEESNPPMARYETRKWDRSGLGLPSVSRMTIRPIFVPKPFRILELVEATFLKGFPKYLVPGKGTLKISDRQIEMTVDVHMDCKDLICPRIIPQPLHVRAPITQVEENECSKTITAVQDLRRQQGTRIEIKVIDHSQSNCSSNAPRQTEVFYQSLIVSENWSSENEAVFIFESEE